MSRQNCRSGARRFWMPAVPGQPAVWTGHNVARGPLRECQRRRSGRPTMALGRCRHCDPDRVSAHRDARMAAPAARLNLRRGGGAGLARSDLPCGLGDHRGPALEASAFGPMNRSGRHTDLPISRTLRIRGTRQNASTDHLRQNVGAVAPWGRAPSGASALVRRAAGDDRSTVRCSTRRLRRSLGSEPE
jgi:hypothetical protein